MYALSMSTGVPFLFTEGDMAHIRKWWCISLMERFQIDGHGQRLAYWTNESRALLQGSLEPIFRIPKARKRGHVESLAVTPSVPVEFEKANRCFILELPLCILSDILKEVVLIEGDGAILKLAVVCTAFRNTVSTVSFRRQAHFQWLDSVAPWNKYSASHVNEFYTMYKIQNCWECGTPYKNSSPGYVGTGKRGVLQAFYSENPHPGYCSLVCSQMQLVNKSLTLSKTNTG
ncbi:uncharacterized protein LOC144005567 isoform X1 [Festucalex cinctus]